jgi:hypothetical protein
VRVAESARRPGKKETTGYAGVKLFVGIGNGRCELFTPYKTMSGATFSRIVLEDLRPAAAAMWGIPLPQTVTIMQDGDRGQNGIEARAACLQRHVQIFPGWPARSAELNPIENLWHYTQERLKKTHPVRETREEYIARIQATLRSTPVSYIRSLVRSMPKRMRECYNNNGGRIGY